ncbi:MAG TPA: hypothetical protein VEY07_04250, partial [Thermoplasmata archaeon]|nr:hypothetical protein [Thermoplasmata archaeon]
TDQGASWSQPALVEADKSYSYCTSACATNQFEGYHSSVIASGSGTPLISYSLPENYQYTSAYIGGIYFFNYTYPTLLAVAQPFAGANVTLNVTSNNLAPGTTWKFELNGQTFSTTSKSLLITNVPKGGTIVINPDNLAAGYGTQISPASSVPSGVLTLNSNGTVFFNFSVSYQLILFIQPSITGYMDLTSSYNGTSYQIYGGFDCFFTCNWYRYWEEYGSSYVFSYVPIGWYFPTGTKIQFQQYQYETSYVNYWNGTGSHAYNGSGIFLNLTMDGPINETGWVGGFGLYNETVQSLGLPSTSTYSFDFNGQPYSAAATKSVTVTDLTNGGYPITNVTATSTTAGWEYFGQPDVGSHVVVPDQPVVNLTFSYVDLASSEGTVSFHAVGLTNGTTWHFSFNGTEYSSSTPWINITTRSGTFPTSAYNVAAANGSVGYTPSGVPTSWSVTTGSTYSVTYVNAYRVIANAGIGGAISGVHGTLWYAAGSSASFHAAPNGAYAFGGWTGTGLGSYSGTDSYANISSVNGPITELASFFPLPQNRFNLTFTESGVPAGTWWTVYLSGRGYSTNQPALLVGGLYPCGPLGTYNLSIPYVYQNGSSLVRYAPGGYHATVCTTGATVVALSFSPQYYLSLGETAGGVAQAQVGGNVYSSSVWVANGTSVLLAAAVNPTYAFLGWNGSGAGSYTGPTESVGLVMLNPMSEIAAFAHPYVPLPPRFWVDFHLSSALAAGSAWTVTFGGTAYSSTSSDLNVTGLLSKPSYAVLVATTYSPDGLTKYTPLGAPTSLAVTHNQTIPLTYSVSYWLSIQASYGGVIAQPTSTSGWTVAGTVVTINATPNEGYVFIGWTGSGPLSYSGTDSVTTIHVTGPTTELAGFALAPPAAKVVTSSTWSAPTTWIGLAAVGLVIGLVVGLLVGRRGGGGPRPAVSDQPWSEGPSDTGGAPASEEPASPPGAEGGA